MPRLTHPAAIRVYDAAQRFIDNALRADDSLFTPGAPIWAPPVIDELYHRFVEHPDESADSFENKFRRQLRGDAITPPADASPETYQFAGELLYIHLLPANGISGKSKRQSINTILKWSSAPVAIPAELNQTLDGGIAKASQYFLIGRPFQITFLLEFVRRWKGLDAATRDQYLQDPWAFKGFVETVPVGSAYAQRELLLHLVHPETFEPIMAREHKQKIAETFGSLADPSLTDVDQQISQIRARLTPSTAKASTSTRTTSRSSGLPAMLRMTRPSRSASKSSYRRAQTCPSCSPTWKPSTHGCRPLRATMR